MAVKVYKNSRTLASHVGGSEAWRKFECVMLEELNRSMRLELKLWKSASELAIVGAHLLASMVKGVIREGVRSSERWECKKDGHEWICLLCFRESPLIGAKNCLPQSW